jgi:hypothetical protein
LAGNIKQMQLANAKLEAKLAAEVATNLEQQIKIEKLEAEASESVAAHHGG